MIETVIDVELFGIPRQRAGVSKTTVSASRLGEAIVELAGRYPDLIEVGLDPSGRLGGSVAANLNGDRFITDPDTPLTEGDVLLILSADAGG